MSEIPKTQYVRVGDYHIAYQVFGAGPPDLLFMRGNTNHIELQWEEPHFAAFLRALGSFARVIVYDDRGSGMSDPSPGGWDVPSEARAEDALAVLDAAGAREVLLLGSGGGGTRALLLAASHPERVLALALVESRASDAWTPDHPFGATDEQLRRMRDPAFVEEFWKVPPELADWYWRYRRLSVPRGLNSAMFRRYAVMSPLDLRHVLRTVHVPTLVVEHSDAPLPGRGRYLAEHLPSARFVELPGRVVAFWRFDDPERVASVVQEFFTGEKATPRADRVLATVLFTDVVESTSANVERGDSGWRRTLDAFDEFARRQVDRFGGQLIKSTGDGHLATFDSPGRAILCACAMRDGVGRFEIELRAGLHTGEIEKRAEDIGGLAVSNARRVCDLGQAGEVLVSSAVPPLVAGSGITFADRGTYALKGVPDDWRLFAVEE